MSTQQTLYVQRIQSVYPDLQVHKVFHNQEGQNNDVLIINDEWVFRFPKYERGIAELQRETAILQTLHDRVSLPIPHPVYQSFESGQVGEVFAGYRMIPGEPLTRELFAALPQETVDTVAAQLGTFLRDLHSVSVAEVDYDLPRPDLRAFWSEMYQQIQEHLFQHMREESRQAVSEHFETFLNDPRHFELPLVLIHADLGMSNILFDAESGKVSGIIDFGFAQVGEPASDFANFLRYNDTFLERIYMVYPEARTFMERCRFYVGTFALQEALFGVEQGDQAAFRAGMNDYI